MTKTQILENAIEKYNMAAQARANCFPGSSIYDQRPALVADTDKAEAALIGAVKELGFTGGKKYDDPSHQVWSGRMGEVTIKTYGQYAGAHFVSASAAKETARKRAIRNYVSRTIDM